MVPGETGKIICEPTLLASLPNGTIFAEINKGVYPQVLQSVGDADYLVTGGILVSTPAGSLRGPKYVVTRGKTPCFLAKRCTSC